MRTRVAFVIAVILACLAICFAADSKTGTPVPATSFSIDRMKADVRFLSSDELQGRKTFTPESRIAAQFIAAEFLRYGLKPAGGGDSYFLPYRVSSYVPDRDHSGIRVEINREGTHIVRDFTPDGEKPDSTAIEVTAPIVFAGYGISAPAYNYDDFASLDVRGKIVMVLNYEPAEDREDSPFKGTWNTRYAYRLYKQYIARQKGAIGMIIVEVPSYHRAPSAPPDPDRIHRGPETPVQTLDSMTPVPTVFVSVAQANELLQSSGSTVSELRQQIDATVKPKSFLIDGVKATIRQASHDRQVLEGRNVVGVLEGSDPKLKDEAIVITAHYDHLGTQDGRVFHGADDNASGVAGMLEIMRVYHDRGIRPQRSIIFVALDSEELLMVGSFAFMQRPPVPLQKTIANLNLDMIGRDEDTYRAKPEEHRNSVNVLGTLYSPQLRAAIERANASVDLTLDYKMDKDDSENLFGRSDHYAFAFYSVPAVLYSTGFHADYHTSRDTWDRLNYEKMAKIVRLTFLTSLDLANTAEQPKFVE
jgi:Zn-dependent M28 family amino/carboxypeptidase